MWAVITTKKSQATMTLEWLRTKVSQRCFGSGVRTGPSSRRYLPTVRGETRMVSFSFNSLAIRSSPQVGFSAAISRISLRRSLGIPGLPGSRDFQRQRRRNPLRRCQRMKYRAGRSLGRHATRISGPESPWPAEWNYRPGVASLCALGTARAVYAGRGSRLLARGETAKRARGDGRDRALWRTPS
jgi:hypothetical protein